MRVVLTANTSWYLFNFRKNLIRELLNANYEVFVIAPPDDYASKLVELGVQYYPLPLSQRGINPFREFLSVAKLFMLFKKIKPEFVLSFTVKCNLYAGICRRFLKFEQIVNISGLGEVFEKNGILNFVVCCLYKFALKKAKRIFFQNDEDMQTILQHGLLAEDICKRISGSGVDIKTFYPSSSYIVNIPLRFFMFGRLVPKKGYDLFLEAAEEICAENKDIAEFWVMGIVDKSRDQSIRLLEKILALQKRGIIKYLPPSDEVVKTLQQVDVVVLPSKYNEGVPRSLLEAMACGKPIITTNWKGCKDTVEDGKNGYLIRPGSKENLCACIMKFVNAPSSKLHKMGQHSRSKAEQEFDERKVIQAYMETMYSKSICHHIT